MRGVTAAWLVFIGAATYRYTKTNAKLPPPSIYLGSGVIYSLLGFVAGPAPGPAAAFGWALVVAALTTGALLPADTAAGPPLQGAALTRASHGG